jgi:hypothetical protein
MKSGLKERHRPKISVTVDPELLREVDRFVAAHPALDRSKVFEEALGLWRARQQERAMIEQFTAPLEPAEMEEREAWRTIRKAAAERTFRKD